MNNPKMDVLLRDIEHAFKDVPFPDHRGLHAALAMDNWVDDEGELKRITSSKDYSGDWRSVPVAHLAKCGSLALNYLDAKGVRFYLPAFMAMAVRSLTIEALSPLLTFLNPVPLGGDPELLGNFREKFSLLNVQQKKVVVEFLKVMKVYFSKSNVRAVPIVDQILGHPFWSDSI